MLDHLTPSAFYDLRDDRTRRCPGADRYQNVRCALYLPKSVSESVSGQALFLVAANLLSRWCRDVVLVAEDVALHGSFGFGEHMLTQHALEIMRDADPFGRFRGEATPASSCDIGIVIGRCRDDLPYTTVIRVNGGGWAASVSLGDEIAVAMPDDGNVMGPAAAACLASSLAFKTAIGLPMEGSRRARIFDVFRLQWIDEAGIAYGSATDSIGDCLIVGGGSVASAAVYFIKFARLEGQLTILDRDVVKIENFSRSPVFGKRNIGLAKSRALAEYLEGSSLRADYRELWWSEYLSETGRSNLDFDLWLPLANQYGVRASMQHNAPPPMIHASTTANWGANFGRHIPGRDDCLIERFPEEVAQEELTCATGKLTTSADAPDASLPFVSFFAGLFVAADLVRAQQTSYPQAPNFALVDFFGSFAPFRAGIASRDRTVSAVIVFPCRKD